MAKTQNRFRQLIDWRAAFISGISSGLISFLLNILLSRIVLGSGWLVINLTASVLRGEGVLLDPSASPAATLILALLVHMVITLAYSLLLVIIIHRWGLIVGFLGGAAFGLAVYGINFYLLSYFFPWFYPLRNWVFLLSHVVFGALAGTIYELLEVERFVLEEEGE